MMHRIIRLNSHRRNLLYSSFRKYSENSSSSDGSESINDVNSKSISSEDEVKQKKEQAKKALFELLSSATKPQPVIKAPDVVTLNKLKSKSTDDTSSSSSSSSSDEESDIDDKVSLHQNVTEEEKLAVKEVAERYGGDVKNTESQLLSSLQSHSVEQSKASIDSLNSIFSGIKIDTSNNYNQSRRQNWKQDLSDGDSFGDDRGSNELYNQSRSRDRRRKDQFESINIFEGEPLNIFNIDAAKAPPVSHLKTWHDCLEREKILSATGPPRNAFEEKIKWTQQGKLWSFPIDNEVGLEHEKEVKFHEHIFLEKHIADWCPKRGPVFNFMNIVTTGLSKNPYITVERKKRVLEWYKNFFVPKEELLQKLGVIEKPFPQAAKRT